MPGISTHINFFKLLDNREINNYDRRYFMLGSIAPDYYINFYDENKSCISHFKKSIFDKSNLGSFAEFISNKNFNYEELSYIKGYHTHLWLDNYVFDFGDSLKSENPGNLDENSVRKLLKENIKIYDIKNVGEELKILDYCNCSSDGFTYILPVTVENAVELLKIFIDSNIDKSIDTNMITLVKESDYYDFLNYAIDTFIMII